VAVVGAGTAVAISQSGPSATVVALTPTELAPDASGTVEISDTPSGFYIELDLDGLPPAAEGSYYQAWLRIPTATSSPSAPSTPAKEATSSSGQTSTRPTTPRWT